MEQFLAMQATNDSAKPIRSKFSHRNIQYKGCLTDVWQLFLLLYTTESERQNHIKPTVDK